MQLRITFTFIGSISGASMEMAFSLRALKQAPHFLGIAHLVDWTPSPFPLLLSFLFLLSKLILLMTYDIPSDAYANGALLVGSYYPVVMFPVINRVQTVFAWRAMHFSCFFRTLTIALFGIVVTGCNYTEKNTLLQ